MNSMSKIDELTKIVNNAESDYKRICGFFRVFVDVIESEQYDKNDEELLVKDATLGELFKTLKFNKITHPDDLFKQYPASLFNDDKYDLQFIELAELGLTSKYDFPLPPMVCEDPKDAKKRIHLEVWGKYKSHIIEDLQEPAARITKAMGEINSYAGIDTYSNIFYRMSAIFQKVKSACAWFDYLDKKVYVY